MDKKRPKDLAQGWFTRRECCEFCGITVAAFTRSWHERIPDAYRRKDGSRNWFYYGRAILDEAVKRNRLELAENKAGESKKKGDGPDYADLLKEEQFLIKRMERWQKQKELAHLKTLNSNLADAGSIFREAGHELRRRFGNDAGEILDDALDEFEDVVNRISDEIVVEVVDDDETEESEKEK